MMKLTTARAAFAAGALVLAGSGTAQTVTASQVNGAFARVQRTPFPQPQYTFFTLPPALLGIKPTGLNAFGAVVGNYFTSNNPATQTTHGFKFENGTYTTIQAPSSVTTLFGGNNDAGDVATIWLSALTGSWQGAIYTNGVFVPTALPAGATDVMPSDVNNLGQHAGYYTVLFARHGYVSDPVTGDFTTVDYPEAVQTNVTALNDKGICCGTFAIPDPLTGLRIQGFTYDVESGIFTELELPAKWQSRWAWPSGIQNSGVVVGVLTDPYGAAPDLGAIWGPGGFQEFRHPDGDLGTSLSGITESGQLSGSFTSSSVPSGGFVATPIP